MITRFVSATGVTVLAAALALGLAPVAATAAPKAQKATTIEIAGKDINGRIVVTQQEEARLFASLLSEVNWMAGSTPQTTAPKADKLGPKYTLVVLSGKTQQQVYDLYPTAVGGPRAHRPAKQPAGKKSSDGWFYGRLTMPETLRVSGVPLKAKPDVVGGGIGGGVGENLAEKSDPMGGVNQVLADIQRLFLLNGAVLIAILVGLAGIAFLIRRRV
ncbi:MAG: hypothetical protein ABW046_06790 [Actinoplanes sp.]